MAPSLRSRKKQTRLAFQPLPSSSPAKSTYSGAVQDRLANVRLEGVKTTQQKARGAKVDDSNIDTVSISDTSLQPRTSAPVSSSPIGSQHTSPTLPSQFASGLKAHSGDDDDDDDDEIPVPSSKRRRLGVKLLQSTIHSSPLRRQSNRSARNISPLSEDDRSSQRSVDGRRSMQSPLRRLQSTRSRKVTASSSYDSSTSAQRIPSRRLSSIGSAETSGDDENVILSKPLQRRRAIKSTTNDPFIVGDDEVEYISSDKEVSIRKPAQKTSRRGRIQIDDFIVPEDEVEYITSDEEAAGRSNTSNRQRDRRLSRKSAHRSRKEQEELEEDLLDLQDSEQEEAMKRSGTRGGPVTTQRDKTREHFERLKRQRAGERTPRIIVSDDDVNDAYVSDDDGIDIDNIGREPSRVEVLSANSSELWLIGAPDGTDQVEDVTQPDVEDGEDDFVVDDENVNLGRHGRPHPDIPLEFTKFASAKPKDLFIHIVEWMVKNKISPAFSREDDVYTMSFSRIDDQVKAQAGSRLISAAWSATFKHAILARPGMKVRALPGLDEDNIRTCDACNRTNHPARYDFQFSGQPYHQDTLEPIEDDEDEDEDGEGDDTEQNNNHVNNKTEYDEKGHLLTSEHTHFYLGRFCAANAEMGHKLSHWKHHLNESVLDYLEEQGVLSSEAIVTRDKVNKKKREKEAEAVVDMMEETGMIQQLWQGFQDNLEDAKFGMEDHVRSGGRGKGRIGSVRVQKENGRIGEWNEGGRYSEVTTIQSDSEGE